MNPLYQTLWTAHIAGGALGLLSFWLPVFFRKGSPAHKRSGRWFVWGMTAAGLSGLAMTAWWLVDPMARLAREVQPLANPERAFLQVRLAAGFLGLLALILLVNLRHGVLVLRAKGERAVLRRPGHVLALGMMVAATLAGILAGFRYQYLLLQVFGGVGLLNGLSSLRYAFKAELSSREWWIEHLNMLLNCGIAAHTAFFVFGGSRFLAEFMTGAWRYLPWLAPTAIGVPAILLASRHYRRKFGPAPAPAPAPAVPMAVVREGN